MAMRILRTFLNFAASNFETADAQPIITMNPVKNIVAEQILAPRATETGYNP
jgi:hypothetical protein